MRNKKKIFTLILSLIVIGSYFLSSQFKNTSVNLPITPSPTPSPTISTEVEGTSEAVVAPKNFLDNLTKAEVRKVVDGDTIELSDGRKLRYIGIDTPETVDPRRPVGCFGKEASAKNKELVNGKRVWLQKDVSETDKYGRLLRYVYLSDGTMVNQFLVREGFAKASSYPPDVKYQELFRGAEQLARSENKGLWAGCGTSSTPVVLDGCTIKGNISSSGEKIYHLPGQKYYNQTVITEDKGEMWFCNEAEAVAAGFRASKL